MTFWRRCEERRVGQLVFPISNWLFNRRGILRQYHELLRTQHASADELREMQLRRLQAVLRHAGAHVPYYQRLFARIGFDPRDCRQVEDLRHIPPLSRQELVAHRLDLVDTRWRRAAEQADHAGRASGEPLPLARLCGKNLIRTTSSGSTGEPAVFYEDGSIAAGNWAKELRLRSWFGVPPGAREARMARVSGDYVRNSRTVVLRRWLWNQLTLPGMSLTEEDFAFCARESARFEPRVLWGITSALVGFAEYLKRHPDAAPKSGPELVVTWAAPLYDHERALLKQVMRCPVTNVYGTREVGHIAAGCEHRTLHVNQESICLEVESVDANVPGELLATTLTPTPMPFIRYRMGDMGVLAGSRCGCGRTLQVIKELTGRTGEVFVTRDGRMISPNFWCRILANPKLNGSVHRFQVVYRPAEQIAVRIARGPGFTEATESLLRSEVAKNLSANSRVEFEYPEKIEARASGKYQLVVNETHD